jgi:hypothetical protein
MNSQVPPGYPDIFGLLSEKSLIKIKAVKSAAVAELLPALSHTIESVTVDMDTLMAHDPSVFFPAFERYTERQYDAVAEELLTHFSDVAQYVWHLATDVTDRISNEIRPGPEFVRENGFLQEVAGSGWLLQDPDPEDQPAVDMDLSVSSGDWETYIERCFLRHLLKYAGPSRRLGDAEFEKEIEGLSVCFRLKYKFYFRQFTRWQGFDTRLRAHLSNRLAHWKAEGDMRAIPQADHSPKTNPSDDTKPKPDQSALAEAVPTVDGPNTVGEHRSAVLKPILADKGYTRSKWAKVAGVDPSVVYDYMSGNSNPNAESRKVLADAIGLAVDKLPK